MSGQFTRNLRLKELAQLWGDAFAMLSTLHCMPWVGLGVCPQFVDAERNYSLNDTTPNCCFLPVVGFDHMRVFSLVETKPIVHVNRKVCGPKLHVMSDEDKHLAGIQHGIVERRHSVKDRQETSKVRCNSVMRPCALLEANMEPGVA